MTGACIMFLMHCTWDGRLWNFIKGAILLDHRIKIECLDAFRDEEELDDVDEEDGESCYPDDVAKVDWIFENALNVGFIQQSTKNEIEWLLEHFPRRMKKYFKISWENWDDYKSKKRSAEECFPELFDKEDRFPKRNKLFKRTCF
jgi:hypothetical protein